jgi:hypothetical protein
MKKVAILVPSFRPAQFFTHLLPKLQQQIQEFSSNALITFEIIALFPDSIQISDFIDEKNLENLTVLRTHEKGFSIPRNLLWNAAKEFDINIFIDDDQVPAQDWLTDYMNCINSNPTHAVFIGQVYYTIGFEKDDLSLSRFLPKNRIGLGKEIFDVSVGMGNSAIVREQIGNLESPFALEFNQGGEDLYLFTLLQKKGFTFFQMSGSSVNEQWDMHRMKTINIIRRDQRGFDAYYMMRHLRIQNRSHGRRNTLIIYSRAFVLFICFPLFLLTLTLNLVNPFTFQRVWMFRFLAKVFSVSLAPWKAKLRTLKGQPRVDLV